MIYEKANAKINLALEVGKEVNGYHTVKNLMVPISLYDELFLEKTKVTQIVSNMEIEDNICLKAFELFKEKFNIDSGVTITLNKNIPIMAGLAGGSSDAAATLRGLNRLFEVNAKFEDLYEIACKLGSDVPFFLYNKAALCTGRGEEIQVLDEDFSGINFLLIKPNFGLSTKEVYKNYKFDGIAKNVVIQKIIEAVRNKDKKKLDELIFNDLEKVALEISPDLKIIYNKIEKISYTPHVSGSGPSLFILDGMQVDLENIKKLDDTLQLFLCSTI